MSLHLGLRQLRDHLDGLAQQSIQSLLNETDPELLAESTFQLAQSLERGDGLPVALRLCELLETDDSVPTSLQRRVEEHRRVLEGRGSGWAQWRQDGQRLIFSQFTGLSMGCFLGMFAGGLVFRGLGRMVESRLAAEALVETERLGASAISPWLTPQGRGLLSGSIGFAGEVATYAATLRGTRHLLGEDSETVPPSLGRELFSAVLFLAPFHVGRRLASRMAPSLANLMRPRYPNDPELLLSTVTWHLTQQFMLMGCILYQQTEEQRGWRPHRPYEELMAEGIFRLLQYNLAQGGVNRLMGPG